MDVVRIGVIGSGGIFRNLHAPHYESTSRAEVVAVADLVAERAGEMAERLGAEAYTDYRRVLDRPDVDAVDIATQPRPHAEIAMAAAQAGKHILVEKPMCRTVAEADAMIAAAKRAGVLLQVAYMMPYHPVYAKLRELLSDGTLGAPHLAYCHEIGWFRPTHPWLFRREESGGMLVEQAIHTLDAWLWLYGPVASVYARSSHTPLGGTYPEPAQAVENNAVLTASFATGCTGLLIKSWAAEAGAQAAGVVCGNGSATLTQAALTWQTHHALEPSRFVPEIPDDGTYRTVAPCVREQRYWSLAAKGAGIEHWLRCIQGEETPETDGARGRAGIEIAEAAYLSARNGMPVPIPPAVPGEPASP
ncbi:MAG: Gfo/Idh/MocA family oxidoreductase [Lentisphaeria bacterium]|nr:Gfo/Idh/MocA family oxidoreductase [Lentisphaeria bacterium]